MTENNLQKTEQSSLKKRKKNKAKFVKHNVSEQKPRHWASSVDWQYMCSVSSVWLLEAMIEGITANFATHYLFNMPLNPFTALAHGIAIKQGLSIYWRLRKDGPGFKIPKKEQ